jgi:hypothetical protein
VDIVSLGTDVGVTLSTVQTASLGGAPYLAGQKVYLNNHHMYGSSRLGIAQYQSSQHTYSWDYEYGLVDTFGMLRSRPWYSYALNAPMHPGTLTPYGNGQTNHPITIVQTPFQVNGVQPLLYHGVRIMIAVVI